MLYNGYMLSYLNMGDYRYFKGGLVYISLHLVVAHEFFCSILLKHPASFNRFRQVVHVSSVSELILQEAKTQFFFLSYHELLTKVLFRTCNNNFRA